MATSKFFEHICQLHCSVPRIRTSEGKVRLVDVPWARKGSGFTLLFEALAMALIEKEMPVNKVGHLLKENPHRIWTIFNHWVNLAYQADDPSSVTQLGFDETSRRKGHKYTFLKNQNSLSDSKKASLDKLITLFPTLGEAYRLKILFNDLWDIPNKQAALAFIDQWCREDEQSKIQPFMAFARTVKSHLSGIVNFVETHITNAILESINNKIQMAKRRARGFRNTKNLINMIYFLCGKLKFNYPLYST